MTTSILAIVIATCFAIAGYAAGRADAEKEG